MDEQDTRRDNEGNELKEVVGHSGSRIRHEEAPVLGANRDDGTDENDGFDTLVISLSTSIYNIHPIKGGCHGMTSLPPLCLPLPASDCLPLLSASSASTPPLLPPLSATSNTSSCTS